MLKQALTHVNPEAGRQIPTQSVTPSLKPTVPRAEESTSKDSGYQLPQPKPITPIQPIAQHVDKPLNWSTFQLPASKPATVPMDVPTNWGTRRTPSQLPKPSTELVDTPLHWNTIQQLPQQIPTIQQADIPLSWNTSQQLQPPQPVPPPQVIVAPAQQQAPVAVQKIGTFSKPSGSVAKVPPMQKTVAAPAVDDRIGTKSSSSSSWITMKNKERKYFDHLCLCLTALRCILYSSCRSHKVTPPPPLNQGVPKISQALLSSISVIVICNFYCTYVSL